METELNILQQCELCPHRCKVDRTKNEIGRCKSRDTVKIAKVSLHRFEEPCISGDNGSGTVFFSNCNLKCVFCQNYEISQQGLGKEISIKRLAEIFLKQQKQGAENINLVTPTSYIPQIIEALKIAKQDGLNIPIVYNTNSYENVETIKSLEGYVDIYLPDLKYAENDLGRKLSNVENYFEIATNAIKEMYRQVGKSVINKNGIMTSGIIIRHLVLPNHIENSKKVVKWIKEELPDGIYISIMAQYFPTFKAKEFKDLNRKLTKLEYNNFLEYLYSLNFTNGFIQDLGQNEEDFVPKWQINI